MSGLPRSAHALVTGGGRGIGRAIASALVRSGATVTVLGRHRATLDDAVAAGAAHFAGVADVADQAAVSAAIAEAAARQPIDILIANAGSAESAPFGKSDAALFRRMMDVNFMGVVHTIQAALPSMKERPYGRIVAVASTAGLKGYAYVSAYSAAKHAVVGLVRSLALELASDARDGQCGVSRVHRYRSRRRQHRQYHEKDRPQPRAGDSRTCEAQSAGPSRDARRKSPIPCCGCAARAPARSPGQAIAVAGGEV